MQNRFSIKSSFNFFLFFTSLFILENTFAQQNFPLNRQWSLDFEQSSNVIPVNDSIAQQYISISSFKPYIITSQYSEKNKKFGYLRRKIFKESLIIVNDTTDKFHLTIDPLLNFETSRDKADNNRQLYKNTRGFIVRGGIGNKFYFESSYYENQATFAQYIDQYIASTGSVNLNTAIVPGQGRAKPFKTNGYDFAMASGYVSYSPNKYFNFQVGHGKHFIGDGYRSLILSDNTFNYPYARITSTYKNIQYTNLYTVFTNLTNGGVITLSGTEPLYQKKIGSYQMLNINLFKRLNLGFVQAMIWEPADTINRQHINFNTFDPLIGVNSAVYGLHSNNNIVLGTTLKLKITNSISIFGQCIADDIRLKSSTSKLYNKYGYQVGFNYFNVFTIKNLHIKAEYNSVRPYTYAAANSQNSYTHYNQALAHPLGANFNEAVFFVNYRIKRLFAQIQLNYAVKGSDSSVYNFGGNVFKSDNSFPLNQNLTSITIAQGLKTTITYQDFQIGYLINKATNLNIVVGVTNRIATNALTTQNAQVIYVGIRTSLSNVYYDF
jgi:hypothetical protein